MFSAGRSLACSVKYQPGNRQPLVYFQTIWPQGSCVLKISTKHCFSLYLQGVKKRRKWPRIKFPCPLSRFVWVPPARCHISHPSQEPLGLELAGFSEGKSPSHSWDREVHPFLLRWEALQLKFPLSFCFGTSEVIPPVVASLVDGSAGIILCLLTERYAKIPKALWLEMKSPNLQTPSL